jgi:hypothetical protein
MMDGSIADLEKRSLKGWLSQDLNIALADPEKVVVFALGTNDALGYLWGLRATDRLMTQYWTRNIR